MDNRQGITPRDYFKSEYSLKQFLDANASLISTAALFTALIIFSGEFGPRFLREPLQLVLLGITAVLYIETKKQAPLLVRPSIVMFPAFKKFDQLMWILRSRLLWLLLLLSAAAWLIAIQWLVISAKYSVKGYLPFLWVLFLLSSYQLFLLHYPWRLGAAVWSLSSTLFSITIVFEVLAPSLGAPGLIDIISSRSEMSGSSFVLLSTISTIYVLTSWLLFRRLPIQKKGSGVVIVSPLRFARLYFQISWLRYELEVIDFYKAIGKDDDALLGRDPAVILEELEIAIERREEVIDQIRLEYAVAFVSKL